jgi:hypothetical protein
LRAQPNLAQVRVWAPMTTCYAFNKFGQNCTENVAMCSVDGVSSLPDGECLSGTCTYNCLDTSGGSGEDSWCPFDNCNSNNYCATQ